MGAVRYLERYDGNTEPFGTVLFRTGSEIYNGWKEDGKEVRFLSSFLLEERDNVILTCSMRQCSV